jgi:hypothetical protein
MQEEKKVESVRIVVQKRSGELVYELVVSLAFEAVYILSFLRVRPLGLKGLAQSSKKSCVQ